MPISLVVLQGPSASGKSTIQSRLKLPRIVTWTSRQPRPGEVDGVDYFFKSRAEMDDLFRNGLMIEMTEYHGNYYGTPLQLAEDVMREDVCRSVVLDRAGADKLRQLFRDRVLLIGIKAARADCERRLASRGRLPEEIADRMSTFDEEVEALSGCDIVLNNSDENLAKIDEATDWIRAGLGRRA